MSLFKKWSKAPSQPSPVRFPEANRNLLKPNDMSDDECRSLWVYTDGTQCISCWKLSWKHRILALIFGRVWLSVMSGATQPPVWVDCSKTVFVKGGSEDEAQTR